MTSERTSLYAAPLFPYIVGAAFGVLIGSIGKAIDGAAPQVSSVFLNTGAFVGFAMMLLAFFEWLDQREIVKHEIREMELHNKLLEKDLQPQPVAPLPEAKIDFPPLSFVQAIWDWRDVTGKFPTVRECVQGLVGGVKFQHGMVTMWFSWLVSAGAIINRTERLESGEPNAAQGWDRAKFEDYARR